MPVELVRSARLAPAPYSSASVVGPGELVFTAGACPLGTEGNVTPLGDVAGQTALALHNLGVALEDAGASLQDVACTRVYVVADDRDQLVAAWHEVTKVFGTDGPPSTLLGVAMLGHPDQLVEIEAVAVTAPLQA
jgi:enamine deaminase RidA (YjgF/YER057c/UK114 family)